MKLIPSIYRSVVLHLLLIKLLFCQHAAAFNSIESPFKTKIIDFDQDQLGFIWIASETTIARFDGYEFQSLNLDSINADISANISDVIITDKDIMYIATNNQGLFEYDLKTQNSPQKVTTITSQNIAALLFHNDSLWVGTENALFELNESGVHQYDYPEKTVMIFSNMLTIKEDGILMSLLDQLYKFDLKQRTFEKIKFLKEGDPPEIIWDMVKTAESEYLLITNRALYQGTSDLTVWQDLSIGELEQSITTLVSDTDKIWLGYVNDGIDLLELNKNQSFNSTHHFRNNISKLTSNEVSKLYMDKSDNLWVGFSDGKLNILGKVNQSMGLNRDLYNHPECLETIKEILHINQDNQHRIWITTADGIVIVQPQEKGCEVLRLIDPKYHVKMNLGFSFQDNDGYIWAYVYRPNYLIGLLKLSNDKQPVILQKHDVTENNITLTKFIDQHHSTFTFGTNRGIVEYDTSTGDSNWIDMKDNKVSAALIRSSIKINEQQYYLATNNGLGIFDLNSSQIEPVNLINIHLKSKDVNSVFKDSRGHTWVGTVNSGLYEFDTKLQYIEDIAVKTIIKKQKKITNILEDDFENLWASTENGLIKISLKSGETQFFDQEDGLQSDGFNVNSAIKASDGSLYFGGVNGFNMLYPIEILNQESLSEMVISELQIFNQAISPNIDYSGFNIAESISYLDELLLSHRDYVFSLKFSALDFTNPKMNQFGYMLDGFDSEWNYVEANNRRATYTNLPSGAYTFKVKVRRKGDVWNDEIKSIVIKIKPAPWLSWWAITSYILIGIIALYGFIRGKIRANQKIAIILREEVNEKTKKLNSQNKTVQSLLAKKNELFSNVSHEFRTPLTLILGPLKDVLRNQNNTDNLNNLNMINRNANRLLSLVEQLLQIARVSDFKKVKSTTQYTQKQVLKLVDSFQHMARSKEVILQLTNNEQATINVTKHFIDAVLGNLISNAIKYTQSGGSVAVNVKTSVDSVMLSVKDTGAGLTKKQQNEIFKRFRRLESHQNIEGIGIGLSVVEELVKINQGLIEVNSEIGLGSEFTVHIPLSDSSDVDETESISTLVNQLQTESLEATPVQTIEYNAAEDSSLDTVLVIEDNHDMREHINSIVKSHYNCLTAENGVKGIAVAIEHVPDIIISDVMMPQMDGFEVAKMIRSDERTSHIPLMLLTALTDKINRIKGWRENVDAYMTKPFDSDELLAQLENMLAIRDILKRKAGQLIKDGQSTSTGLPKKDQEFIDKLIDIIRSNYQDPLLKKVKIASKMAISERQLQRKVKALIDQNPMDMLREYRLNKSKDQLKDGYQVSQVADECGFNSLSYFSKCFKAQFGVSPKQFQQA